MYVGITAIFLVCKLTYAVDTDLLVGLSYGTIRGRVLTTATNKVFRAFQGIPYAAPPLGALRFQAPQPPISWEGVKSTDKDSNTCYSVTKDSDEENEDCLYLNVYTPVLTAEDPSKLAVMVWIYGGAYRTGSDKYNNCGPDFLIEKDVVVVTLNYRLGPFGFLATEDGVVYGNAGLKDQALALKWVHDQIELFGGDPDKITIFGQSAGGSSVGYQLLYTKNEGLFRGAILQSGSPLSQFSFMGDISARAYAFDLAGQINSTMDFKNDSTKLLSFLLSVPAKQIDIASTKTTVTQRALPVIEPDHDGAFITKGSYEKLWNGEFIRVPIMIGATSEEAITTTDLDILNTTFTSYEKKHEKFVPEKGFHFKSEANASIVGNALYDLYFTNTSSEDKVGYFLRYKSDNQYIKPVTKHADFVSWYTQVYFYIFSYDGQMGNFNRTIQGADKVGHGEDEKYMWRVNSSSYSNADLSIFPEKDVLTHKRVIELWTNFAKYLNPTPEKSDLLQNVTWSRVRPYDFKYLDIGDNLVLKENPRSPYYDVWSQIYDEWNERPFTVF